MNEKVSDLLKKVKLQYNNLNPKLRKTILMVTALVIIFSVGTAIILNNKPYETLFSGLNQQEASEIMGKLQEMGVTYKYGNDGVISVPKDVEPKVKAQLVFEGYPKSGFTYDIFKENINMMTTDFEKDNYKLFELQNRIGSTIRLFEGVKDAKVTIAVVEDKKYVLDRNSNQKAKASVVVIMNNGGSPTSEQVKGIQRLVSKSIPNMEMEDVVVIDGNGNDVSAVSDNTPEGSNKLKIEFEKHMDDSLRGKILNVLSPIYGAENVRVSVRTTVDVDKKIREITNHATPNEGSDKGIPSSEVTDIEVVKDGAAAGGVPGTETNADIPTYGQVEADGTETYYKNQNTVDYLVNQLKEQSQIESGSIEDITVSVAINGNTTGSLSERQVKELIGSAAGITKINQDDKITVVAAPFFDNKSILPNSIEADGKNNWIIIGAIATGTLLIILIIILVVIRKNKNKKSIPDVNSVVKKVPKMSQEAYLKQLLEKQQEEKENQILNLTNEKGLELKNKVRELSDQNPEISAQLIRNWLKGGE